MYLNVLTFTGSLHQKKQNIISSAFFLLVKSSSRSHNVKICNILGRIWWILIVWCNVDRPCVRPPPCVVWSLLLSRKSTGSTDFQWTRVAHASPGTPAGEASCNTTDYSHLDLDLGSSRIQLDTLHPCLSRAATSEYSHRYKYPKLGYNHRVQSRSRSLSSNVVINMVNMAAITFHQTHGLTFQP